MAGIFYLFIYLFIYLIHSFHKKEKKHKKEKENIRKERKNRDASVTTDVRTDKKRIYSILPITRTSKGPMKMVRVNECSSYPG